MFTGPSSSTPRLAPCARSSSAWRLVSEAAKRQPALPVQATSPARIEVALTERPSASSAAYGPLDLAVRHAGDHQVLPDRQADIAVPERARDAGQTAHLRGGQLADRQHDADPVQAGLLLRMHADMRRRSTGGRGANASRRNARQLAAELLLDQRQELLDAPGIEDVFEPRLVAVGAVAVIDEHAHDRRRRPWWPRPA